MFYEFKRAAIETEEKYQMDLSNFKISHIKDEINDDNYKDCNDVLNVNLEVEYLKEEEEEYSEENEKINILNFNNNIDDTDEMKQQVEFENIYFDYNENSNNQIETEDYVTEEIIEDYLESDFDEEIYELDQNNDGLPTNNNIQDNQFQIEFLKNIRTDIGDSKKGEFVHTKATVAAATDMVLVGEDDSDYIVEEEFEDLETMRKRKRKPTKPLPTNEFNEYICRHFNCKDTFPSKYQLIVHT